MPLRGATTSVVTGVRFTRTGPGAMRAGTGSPTGRLRVGDPRSATAGAPAQRMSGTPTMAAVSRRRVGRGRRADIASPVRRAGRHRPRPARDRRWGGADDTLAFACPIQGRGRDLYRRALLRMSAYRPASRAWAWLSR